MAGYKFNNANLSFYSNDFADYPDEIDITVINEDFNEENKATIINGTYIFLDNYLGELAFAVTIDNVKVLGKKEAEKDLIPIDKLKDFLKWRHKEFMEKYDGVRYDTHNDNCSILEAELESGHPLIAVINTELMKWDRKASHPWIGALTIKFGGSKNNGMPVEKDYKLLDAIEEEIMQELRDIDGYLNIGRQTANGEREITLPVKTFVDLQKYFSSFKRNTRTVLKLNMTFIKTSTGNLLTVSIVFHNKACRLRLLNVYDR